MTLQELFHKPQAVSWYSKTLALPDTTQLTFNSPLKIHHNIQNDKNWL